jgi:hypothetical protein
VIKEQTADQLYRAKCDELSEKEASTHDTRIGRWFLEDGMVSTWVCQPDDFGIVRNLYMYQFATDKVFNQKDLNDWLEESGKFQWVGIKGQKDLGRILRQILKRSKKFQWQD